MICRLFAALFFCLGCAVAGGTIDLENAMDARRDSVRRVPGRSGYAWDFYHDAKLLNGKEYSFSSNGWGIDVWFRLSDPQGKSVLLGANRWQNFQLSIVNGSGIQLIYHSGDRHHRFFVPYQFTPGLWYQLAITQNQAGVIDFYVNGRFVMSHDAKGATPGGSAHVAVIGSYHIDSKGKIDHVFKGLIDRPRLHDFVPTAESIKEDWRKGNATLPLIPMPQQVRENGNQPWKRPGKLQILPQATLLNTQSHAWRKFQAKLKSLNIAVDQSASAKLLIAAPDSEQLPGHLKEYIESGEFPIDGYLLSLNHDRMFLVASSSRGFYYGLLALTELFDQKTLMAIDIFDWPEFPLRAGMVVIDSEPPMNLSGHLKRVITQFSELRLKYAMIRTHDWAMIDKKDVQDVLKQLVDFAASREVVILPYLQTYSHAKGFLKKDPRFGHTETVSDEKVVMKQGESSELAQKNVVITVNTPIIVRNTAGELMTEGKDYNVSVDEIKSNWNFPAEARQRFSWVRPYFLPDSGACRLELVAGSRIKSGDTVSVVYDVSSRGECTCPFSEEYAQWQEKCIEYALKLTGSDYINMGLDEIWIPRGKGRCCAGYPLSEAQTIVHAFNTAQKSIGKHPGVKMLAFSDMLDPRQTPSWKTTQIDRKFERDFDSQIHMMPWYYGDDNQARSSIEQSSLYFLTRGYPLVGTSGKIPLNQLFWGEVLLTLRDRYPVDGFFYTMWDDSNTKLPYHIGLTAYSQMSWSPNRLYLPSANKLRALLSVAGISPDMKSEDELKLFGANHPDWLRDAEVLLVNAERELADFGQQFPLKSLRIQQIEELTNAVEQAKIIIR